jgi:multidrug efflux pump subunit AcrA (membrane-fusion protein)
MAEERHEDERLFGPPGQEDPSRDARSDPDPAASDPPATERLRPAAHQGDVPTEDVMQVPPGNRSSRRSGRLSNRMRGALVLAGLIVVLGGAAAFLATSQGASSTSVPGSVEVTAGSIRSTVNLKGVVVREATQNVSAPVTGTLTDLAVRPGDAVSVGEELATVTINPAVSPSPSPTASPSPSPTPTPTPITETVRSPIAGTVGRLAVTRGQTVVTGQSLLTVIPSRYDVIASVPQDQLYRFYTQPLSIQAVIPQQVEPLDCAYQSIGENLPTSGAGAVLGQEVDLRCILPDGTPVFPGVRADVVAVTAEVDDALTLPLSAVERSGSAGVVWLVEKGRKPARTNVTLGISDGHRVQIVSGLFAGQRVRNPATPPSS